MTCIYWSMCHGSHAMLYMAADQVTRHCSVFMRSCAGARALAYDCRIGTGPAPTKAGTYLLSTISSSADVHWCFTASRARRQRLWQPAAPTAQPSRGALSEMRADAFLGGLCGAAQSGFSAEGTMLDISDSRRIERALRERRLPSRADAAWQREFDRIEEVRGAHFQGLGLSLRHTRCAGSDELQAVQAAQAV